MMITRLPRAPVHQFAAPAKVAAGKNRDWGGDSPVIPLALFECVEMNEISRFRFREDYRVMNCTDHGVFLYSERDFSVLTGKHFESVAPYFDGNRTIGDIVELLEPEMNGALVYYAAMQLQKKGLLVEVDSTTPARARRVETDAFWRVTGHDPKAIRNAAQKGSIALAIVGDLPADCLDACMQLLFDANVEIAASPGQATLTVVLTDNYLRKDLDVYQASGKPWMLMRPIGGSVWLGPYFDGEGACLHCMQQRLEGHRMVESFLARKQNLTDVPDGAFAYTKASIWIAAGAIALELQRALNHQSILTNKIISFDTSSLSSREHILVQRPQCPTCGDPSMNPGKAITLSPVTRNAAAESGHRAVAPEDTVRRFQHHVSPITGIIRELIPLKSESDTVKHIYSAGHNFAMMVEDVSFLRATLRMGSGGKGKTDMQAKASAIGEALERYSGLFQGNEARTLATMADMGPDALHPNDMLLFSDHQFDIRKTWNLEHDRYQYIPEKFDPSRPVEWSPIWSLTQNRMRYLPTACLYYGYSHHPLPRSTGVWTGFSNGDSNGCAAGNTVEEAIMQGLFELAERDSVACWWYSRCQRPQVDLSTFDEPYFAQMQVHFAQMNRVLWVLDVTNDLGIPTFVAVSYCPNEERQEITWGCGAHIEPKVAILRALTEVNQFLAAFEQFSSDSDRYVGFDPEAVRWFESATVQEQSYLLPSDAPARTAADYERPVDGDLTDVLTSCIAKVEAKGLEVLVLDQTREDVGLNVVRVVVPGLRHFFARFAPGRLYDVPHQLGWVDRPLSEAELNPIPVFF
jgi:oxazoline/thiazoline synthase